MPGVDADALLAAAALALRPVLGPVSLVPAGELPGSDRSSVMRARARTRIEEFGVVLKAPTGSGMGGSGLDALTVTPSAPNCEASRSAITAHRRSSVL